MAYPRYNIPRIDWAEIVQPMAQAEDALARLDDRILKSPLREGWTARTHFLETQAIVLLEGELVTLEELVLHDARMDIRAPTKMLAAAHTILRTRRRLARLTEKHLTIDLVRELRGAVAPSNNTPTVSEPIFGEDDEELPEEDFLELENDDELARTLQASEALALKASLALSKVRDPHAFLIYDEDWNEGARLKEWASVITHVADYPPTLAAVVIQDAWIALEPFEHAPGFGPLICSAALRSKTRAHLAPVGLGQRTISTAIRKSPKVMERYKAGLQALAAGAEIGMKNHETWMATRALLSQKLIGHRANSRLPQLVEMLLAKPLVSTGMIANELSVSRRAAQDLIGQLGVREITGRGRFRAWSTL